MPWLLLPPVLLIVASEIKPVYVPRYVVFCLPALALLAGAGLAALGRCWRIAALSVLALLTLPMQQAIRQPCGPRRQHQGRRTVVQAQAKPGDAVLYFRPGFRDFGAVYPYGFTRLRDIGLQESAVAAGNLSGTEVAATSARATAAALPNGSGSSRSTTTSRTRAWSGWPRFR